MLPSNEGTLFFNKDAKTYLTKHYPLTFKLSGV